MEHHQPCGYLRDRGFCALPVGSCRRPSGRDARTREGELVRNMRARPCCPGVSLPQRGFSVPISCCRPPSTVSQLFFFVLTPFRPRPRRRAITIIIFVAGKIRENDGHFYPNVGRVTPIELAGPNDSRRAALVFTRRNHTFRVQRVTVQITNLIPVEFFCVSDELQQ